MLYKVKLQCHMIKEIVYIGKQILFYLYLFTSTNSKITTLYSILPPLSRKSQTNVYHAIH